MYKIIKDPVTGHFVKTDSKRGKKILNDYKLYYLQQGGFFFGKKKKVKMVKKKVCLVK